MVRERPVSVQFFRLDSGREPVRDWLKGMRREHRKAIGEDVKTLQFGWPIGMLFASTKAGRFGPKRCVPTNPSG